jgi:hypothetical protein
MSEEKRDWKAEAEEALQKTGDSLAAAWDATRDGRMMALEKAKEAARQLGEAIDHGVAAAKDRWSSEQAEAEGTEAAAEDQAGGADAAAEEE